MRAIGRRKFDPPREVAFIEPVCAGKVRYLFPLDAETRERLLAQSKPYPSRSSSESGAPSDQDGTGAAEWGQPAPQLRCAGSRLS